MNQRFMLAVFSIALFVSCKKTGIQDPQGTVSTTAIAPDGFNFSTSKKITLDVQLLTNDNKPLKGVLVNVYAKENTQNPVFTSLSDANGNISASLNMPSRVDTLIIDPAYVGLMRNAVAVVKNNAVNCVIGGSEVFSGDIVPSDNAGRLAKPGSYNNKLEGSLGKTIISYLGSYDTYGRPLNLVRPDVISAQLLTYLNASLPESKSVAMHHPDFLSGTAKTDLDITETSDVWLTFVHEGASFYNTLGFYTYPTNHPPQTISDIDSIQIVIPNASLLGSGGNMHSGDKIKLGRFEPGTSIGYVLLQNAWSNNTKTVNVNATKYFSDDILNNEKAGFKRHTVLLYDANEKLFLHGFEDLQRDNGASDNDFNDVVFYTTSNPVEAIPLDNINPIDQPLDSDGDGVSDIYDKFPNDPTRAYIQYFPSQSAWGTLAFEDLWPSIGDYDMNDMVVGYQYTFINNAQNKTVEFSGDFVIRCLGATKRSGFGIQLPCTPDKISSITGQKLLSNYISINTNGTEAGQAKTVFIPFDDPKALMPGGLFVNNMNGRAYVKSDTAHLKFTLTAPLAAADLGIAPFNPFLIVSQQRGYEIHLPGQLPTDKANTRLFGTDNDNTVPSKNKYYLSADNWPWALSFLEDFDYPTETHNISTVYSYFLPWAKSGGTQYADWYTNKPGYRNTNLIYTH